MDLQQQYGNKYDNTDGVDTKEYIKLQHYWRAVYVGFTLCLGYVINGYSITMISATSITLIRQNYHTSLSNVTSISLLNAMVPFGAMFGILIFPLFTKIANKKYIHFVYFVINVIGCSISIIPNIESILIGRFIIGILNSAYTTTASSYIKQLFSLQYRKPFGASYSAARVFGILLCYSIQHYFIFFGTVFIALVQLILLYFVPLSPIQLINMKEYQMAERSINRFYYTLDVQRRLKQIIQQQKEKSRISVSYQGRKIQSFNFFSSINLAISRNFCGVTYIVVYCKSIVSNLGLSIATYAPFIINGVLFISGLLGILLIKRFKRKYMLIYSNFFMCVFLLLVGCADLLNNDILVLVALTIYMIPCGAGFQPITWYYGNELVGPDRGRICTFFNWFSSALVIFIPPYVTAATQNNNAFPIFFFFAAYLCFSFYSYSFVLQQVEHFRQMPMMIQLAKTISAKKKELLG